jgi:Polysaccharide deacetylase
MIEKVMRRVLALPNHIPGYVATTRRLRSGSIAVLAYHGLVREPLPVFNWSHPHTHQILSRCSPQRQAEELSLSRDILRERLRKADLFAYSNGRRQGFNDDTKQLLRQTGYRCAVSTIPGLQPAKGDLYEIRRVSIGADTSLEQFELRMAGL